MIYVLGGLVITLIGWNFRLQYAFDRFKDEIAEALKDIDSRHDNLYDKSKDWFFDVRKDIGSLDKKVFEEVDQMGGKLLKSDMERRLDLHDLAETLGYEYVETSAKGYRKKKKKKNIGKGKK